MEPFDLDDEELKSLLGAAGRVTPPGEFTRQVMARVANAPVPATVPGRMRWRRAMHRLVALVLPGTLLGSMFLLLAAGGRSGREVIAGQWLAHPLAEALSRPASLIALLSLALAVWALVYLARQTGQSRRTVPSSV